MEFEEGAAEFIQASPDMILEMLANQKHYDTPAAKAHWNIATRLWPQLKALEYTTGRLLAVGPDIDLLTGAPPGTPRVTDYIDGYEDGDVLAADLPGADQWPHHGMRLQLAPEHDVGRADLVIASLPLADARLLTRDNRINVTMKHHELIQGALPWLRPGGLLVTLAHRQFLDGPDTQPRRSIARQADLIAAARLPASALRQAPLLDSPVDLLLLRRREAGHPPSGLDFIDRSRVHVHDVPDMLINDCYAAHPWAVLGNIVPDPIEPGLTSVAPIGGDFSDDLDGVLGGHVDDAIELRLYAQERPARTRAPRPSPPGERARTQGTDSDTPAL